MAVMRALGWLLACGACNQVYGLDATKLGDAGMFVVPDGAVRVTPPPGPTVCGAMPDFESWTYGVTGVAPTDAFDLSPYGATRAIVVGGPNRRELWDVDLVTGDAAQLTALAPPAAAEFREPAVAPDGSVVWFRQAVASQGVFVATRASGWEKARESFGLVDPFQIEPGSPAFHDGTLRMVVVLQEQESDPRRLVELSSPDGVTWTRLSTVTFDQAAVPGLLANPDLSADGCFLVFATEVTIPYTLYVVPRDAAKQFSSAPIPLAAASVAGRYPTRPALAPDLGAVWFAAQESTDPTYRMFRGGP